MKKLMEDCKSGRKCEKLSDFIDVYFTEPAAMLVSRAFLKLNLHPNVATFCSLIVGVVGGIFFIFKSIYFTVAAIFLVILSLVFDASDGQIARLGNKRSSYGRWLDGLCDGIVYAAIYFGVSLRLMSEKIPFHTSASWGWYIWIFSAFVGVFLHGSQARMADYLRNLHMFFIQNEKGNELSRAKALKAKKDSFQGQPFSIDKLCAGQYYTYTKAQEKATPHTQKLLDALELSDEETARNAKAEYARTSDKWCATTNLLTVNCRTYLLFVLALCNAHFFIFPFVILLLEPFKLFLTHKYERLAKRIYEKYYLTPSVIDHETQI